MSGRWNNGRSSATRVLLALVAVIAGLGSVVAYAATRSEKGRTGGDGERHAKPGPTPRPLRPRFIEVPAAVGVGAGGQFRFHVAAPAPEGSGRATPAQPRPPAARWRRFECRLDDGDWVDCSSPYVLPSLDPADHSFAVRALSRQGRAGPAAHYAWSQLAPQEFTIDPQVDSLEELMPGAPPQQLPVRIDNPNPVPIEVTGLTVAIAPQPPGCPSDPNFSITPSTLSAAAPLSLPAGGSVSLPSAGATAPAIALRELPLDQNACQGATVSLVFSGEARG
jgi:hypothetical protein